MSPAGPTKRVIVILNAVLASASLAMGQVYVSPDVPVDPDGAFLLPWNVVEYRAAYITRLNLPGEPAIDALHRMDKSGSWLFSVEASPDGAGRS